MDKYYTCIGIDSETKYICSPTTSIETRTQGLVTVPDYVPTFFDPLVLSWKLKKPVLVFRQSDPPSSNGEGAVWNASRISILGKAT